MICLKKFLSAALASLLLLSSVAAFAGCADNSDKPDNSTINMENIGDDDRFVGVDYKNRPFRIYTSTNVASPGMGNSNFLIEGIGKSGGGIVSDAVFERNTTVEELLKVKLEFTPVDLSFDYVAADIRKLTQSGIDEYDLVINDIYAYSELVIEGNFRNVIDEECVFDFERDYWYKDFMDDLCLIDGYQYFLAGDFFADIIRSAHLLLLNKEIYENFYNRSSDELYDVVTDYKWTYEKMNEIITDKYTDSNYSNTKDAGDLYGFMIFQYWGPSIPFSVSGMNQFIERDEDGTPTITVHQGDRANQLASAMSTIFNNQSTSIGHTTDEDLITAFTQDECLILGYQRLGSLENEILRQMEGDAAVLPYPMLFESDRKYTTATHDTTEMGAILATSTDMKFISTVVEVLNRETARIVMPKYYTEGLQVRYVDDEKAAAMIDIIHDNFDNSFILAYNTMLGSTILQSFSDAVEQKREFSAVFASASKTINKTLNKKINQFKTKNQID